VSIDQGLQVNESDLFDEEYYRTGCGPVAYERSDHWISFFGLIAEHLIRSLKPARVLDAGCAMGFLVEAFWDRGVEAWGIDISPYAIAKVRRDMEPFCRTASLTEPIQEAFDLITCIEVVEHMTEDNARVAIANLCAATGTILFSSSPSDFTEPTHFSVRPPLFWLKLYAECGFYPDLGYDAGFVTPHAMLLRKNIAGMSDDVLALYAEHIRTRCLLHERQQSLSAVARENSQLVEQNAAMTSSIALLESRVAGLQGEEQALRAQIDNLNGQLESANRRIDELADARTGLEQTNTQLSSELAALEDRFASVSREMEAASAAHDRYHAQVSEMLSAAKADGERTRGAAEQLVSQAQGLKERVDEVSLQLRDLLESRIWRTLRWTGGLMLRAGSLGGRSSAPVTMTPVPTVEKSEYETWIEDFEAPASEVQVRLNPAVRATVILPVAEATPDQVRATVSSLKAQSYSNWELAIVCASANAAIDEVARQEPRIRVITSPDLPRATDGFTLLMNAGDTLNPDAMLYLAEAFERSPDVDLVYSDEDRLSREGKREQPFFKPDFSPDLLLSKNYMGRLVAARNAFLEAVGEPWSSELDSEFEYDLVLRLAEKAHRVVHIPQVLYHRADGSTTACSDAGGQAIQRHLARRGISAVVKPGAVPGCWRVCYDLKEDLHVSIIIASGGNLDVLKTNIDSLFAKTTYPHYEVVIADNSAGDAIDSYFKSLHGRHENVRYIDWRNRFFNYSAINNAAARTCTSPLLLFLNDDTTVIEPDWLTAMAQLSARPEVGAVGAKLLYPDGRIQHAGVVMGLFGNCGHAFKGLTGSRPHYFGLSDLTRNVSAVTGDCLMTRAEVFREVGGFDENNLRVAFNDVDLCLRIGGKGYRILYTPHAVLYHHEAYSKGANDVIPNPAEVTYMQTRWREVIAADPYYSPNLSRTTEDYSLRQA
jgi:GT2 family glycosyltransferase/predicted nuclease with TOPRIM domain